MLAHHSVKSSTYRSSLILSEQAAHPWNTSHVAVRGSVQLWLQVCGDSYMRQQRRNARIDGRIGTFDKETTSPLCRNPTGSHCSQNVVHLSMDPNTLACALFTPEISSFHSKKLIPVQDFLLCQIPSYHNSLTPKVFAQTIFDDLQ